MPADRLSLSAVLFYSSPHLQIIHSFNMMKQVVFLALLACAWAAPKPEAATAEQPAQISDFVANAQKNLNELAASIQSQLNLPDQEAVVNTLKNQSSTFVSQVQGYINQVSNEIKDKAPELEKLWGDVKGKLSKVADDINANVPNAKESAEQLQKQFQDGVQTFVKETNTIADQFKQNSGQFKEDIATFTKKAVDLAVNATQQLNEQLKAAGQEAAAAAEKKP